MNKHAPHVYVIPEDRADARIANGFVEHYRVKARHIQVMPPAGGWSHVLKTFEDEYVGYLHNYPLGHVVLLVDFDGDYEDRRRRFGAAVPEDLRERVFVLGARQDPQTLKRELELPLEVIGTSLADDCHGGTAGWWDMNGLAHNEPDRQRLSEKIRPFLFDL